jgi:hypothetical protein
VSMFPKSACRGVCIGFVFESSIGFKVIKVMTTCQYAFVASVGSTKFDLRAVSRRCPVRQGFRPESLVKVHQEGAVLQ